MPIKHLHHDIVAYQEVSANKEMIGATIVTVLDCLTEEEALKKAKSLISRPFYFLQKIYECRTCAVQAEQLANSRYLTAKLGKHLDNE